FRDRMRAETEQRHDGAKAQRRIDVRAADAYAGIRQDISLAVGGILSLQANAHDRKVGRAAADIRDKDEFFPLRLLLVVNGSGNRLIFEVNVSIAGEARNIFEYRLRLRIGNLIVVDEMHGAAMHDACQLAIKRCFRTPFHLADKEGDDLAEEN